MSKNIVLKVGGAVMYDHLLNLNHELLEKVKYWYFNVVKDYDKVLLVVGGGSLSRDLQKKIEGHIGGSEYLHDISMNATQTNASVLRGYIADDEIYVPKKLGDAYEYIVSNERVRLVSGGLKVGWSTDMDAAVFADVMDCDEVMKISNIDYIYDKDPNTFSDAVPIRDMTWKRYFEIFNITDDSEHEVNNSSPVDKECALFSHSKDLSFRISGGENITKNETVEEIFQEGTLIHP